MDIVGLVREPLRLIRVLLRWSWLIILVGLLAVGSVWFAFGRDSEARATARVSLTQEVVWPFYDVARERVRASYDDTMRNEIADQLGLDPAEVDVTIEQPDSQAYLDVVARSTDLGRAVAVANATADALVASELAVSQGEYDAAVAAAEDVVTGLRGELGEVGAQIDLLFAEKETAADEYGALQGSPDQPAAQVELERIANELEVAEAEQNSLVYRISEAERAVEEARTDVARNTVEPGFPATVERGEEGGASLQLLALGAMVGLLIGAGAALVLDRDYGSLLDLADLESRFELPVVDATGVEGWENGALALLRLHEPGAAIGVAAGTDADSALAVAEFGDRLARAGVAAALVYGPDDSPNAAAELDSLDLIAERAKLLGEEHRPMVTTLGRLAHMPLLQGVHRSEAVVAELRPVHQLVLVQAALPVPATGPGRLWPALTDGVVIVIKRGTSANVARRMVDSCARDGITVNALMLATASRRRAALLDRSATASRDGRKEPALVP